ncbi:MAG: MFS transporter [Anaerolineae bacterium]
MAQRSEIGAVYGAGLIQGLVLVTFPAASSIFTSPQYYGLSNTAYGAMFLPQAITAIAASLAGAGLSRRMGIKRIYLLGLAADLVAMTLLFLSQFVMANHSLAYGMLLAATGSLGIGFGLTVPSLNTFAAVFFPQRVDSAVLIMNALLGLGTALAPLFVAVFVGLGIWWGLPVLAAVLVLALLLFSSRLPLRAAVAQQTVPTAKGRTPIPSSLWLYAGFALLYGICETMNGNWATLYMTGTLGASTTLASIALTAFWGMVTVGRVFFAAIEKHFPETRTYRVLPFVVAAAFLITSRLPTGDPILGVLAFGLAGFGCSALLPLTISFGQTAMSVIAASVAGGLIAFYQMGYGIAAFGVGPIEDHTGVSLSTIFGLAAIVALAMAAVAFVIVQRSHAPAAKPKTEPA